MTAPSCPSQMVTCAPAKAAGGIGQWRMTEANSYSHGGAAGVSDVQAAALWALDFMYGDRVARRRRGELPPRHRPVRQLRGGTAGGPGGHHRG